ncbi:MAG: tRNA(Ile)(2)-agmatinylcytidine synthase, partial [Candidatus Hodarchaeota archaeon]
MPHDSHETIHIGIDDTDSLDGMCTTYLAYRLVNILSKIAKLIDFPNLVRLNPNIPLKTRGNGAICIRCEVNASDIPKMKKLILDEVDSLAHLQDPKTNSGVAFYCGE